MSTEQVIESSRDASPSPAARSKSPIQSCMVTALGYVRKLDWRVGALILLALVLIPVWRATTGHAKPSAPSPHAIPVAVAKVTREDLVSELSSEAELRPYQEIDLHAKVAGYLEKINVDIGDRVEAGQLLAVIEIPELGDDIRRAKAALQRNKEEVERAQAVYDDAHTIFGRLRLTDKDQPGLIAPQDLDAARDKDRAASSALAAAKAEVDVTSAELSKLQTMLKYSQITAPFSGVITKRYADPGALIQAGTSSSTQTLPLVRLSQNDRLRLDIPVSISHVSQIKLGDPVTIYLKTLGQSFRGKIARSTCKLETATRTMDVEVDVPNPDFRLIPGMYAVGLLTLEHREKALTVPVASVSRKKNCTVLVVDKDHKVREQKVSLGLETPEKLEVLAGLKENDLVLIGSRTQIKPGQQVEPKLIEESGE